MATLKPLPIVVFTLTLIGALPGCATYRQCGLHGCPGDVAITNKVRNVFNQYPEIGPPNSITVQTLDHVVYLSGFASDGLDRTTAESVAAKVPGVTRVTNSIAVTH